MTWAIMSVTPAAVWYGGRVKVSSGSMKAMTGRCSSLERPRLSWHASLVMTAEALASEPAAGMVSTLATSSLPSATGLAAPTKRSQTSPS